MEKADYERSLENLLSLDVNAQLQAALHIIPALFAQNNELRQKTKDLESKLADTMARADSGDLAIIRLKRDVTELQTKLADAVDTLKLIRSGISPCPGSVAADCLERMGDGKA